VVKPAARPRLQRVSRIHERMAGAQTALGSDLMNGALEGYAVLKVSGKGEGMEALRRLLSQRFTRTPRAPDPRPRTVVRRVAATDPKRSLARYPAAGLLLLDRWARRRAVRAEHAAIAFLRAQHSAAARALVEELTRCRRHRFNDLVLAFWARQNALQLQLSHRSLSPWPGSRHR
jgi:hypothetical protein